MRKVICPYDSNWPVLFQDEACVLRRALGETLLALHHIGSTAVPGLLAKPVIDILGEARCLDEVDDKAQSLRSRGYEARGEYGIEGRRYFSKARIHRDGVGYHVHIFARGSAHIGRHLQFRDYLIAEPAAANAYAELKLSLSDSDGCLVSDYAARKAPLVERIERHAMLGEAWTQDQGASRSGRSASTSS